MFELIQCPLASCNMLSWHWPRAAVPFRKHCHKLITDTVTSSIYTSGLYELSIEQSGTRNNQEISCKNISHENRTFQNPLIMKKLYQNLISVGFLIILSWWFFIDIHKLYTKIYRLLDISMHSKDQKHKLCNENIMENVDKFIWV